MNLITQRLSISPWKKSDLDSACKLWGDPHVMALIDSRGGLNRQQVEEPLAKEIATQEKYGVQYWKVTDTKTGEVIGCCGLRPWPYDTTDPAALEIGFHIGSQFWGKGFATEAAQAVIDHAFSVMGLKRLFAGHHPKNEVSRKVLLKLGFKYLEDVFYEPTGLNHPSYRLDRT